MWKLSTFYSVILLFYILNNVNKLHSELDILFLWLVNLSLEIIKYSFLGLLVMKKHLNNVISFLFLLVKSLCR